MTTPTIESVLTTMRLRTVIMTAAKTWRRLKGENLLPKVIQGGAFKDDVEIIEQPTTAVA